MRPPSLTIRPPSVALSNRIAAKGHRFVPYFNDLRCPASPGTALIAQMLTCSGYVDNSKWRDAEDPGGDMA
jgi:hypothetical protein